MTQRKLTESDQGLPVRSQLENFKQAARELETDDDEARFDQRMKKLVKHKQVPDKGA